MNAGLFDVGHNFGHSRTSWFILIVEQRILDDDIQFDFRQLFLMSKKCNVRSLGIYLGWDGIIFGESMHTRWSEEVYGHIHRSPRTLLNHIIWTSRLFLSCAFGAQLLCKAFEKTSSKPLAWRLWCSGTIVDCQRYASWQGATVAGFGKNHVFEQKSVNHQTKEAGTWLQVKFSIFRICEILTVGEYF